MSTVKAIWTDSATPGVLGNKIFRDDVEIADVAQGVQELEDSGASPDTNHKYEIQAYTATHESNKEELKVNMDYIQTVPSADVVINYVFDGGALSYMFDNSITPSVLDGIVNQTWVIRVKRTANDVQHGLLGLDNTTNGLKLEVDASDNKMDSDLRDTGLSTFINGTVSTDGNWHTYYFYFENLLIGVQEDGVLVTERTNGNFTGRTAGRVLAVGAAVIGGAVGNLIGEISDLQLYNKKLSQAEIDALELDLATTATGLVANWAGNKSGSGGVAGDWIDEVGGVVLANKGTVSYN